MKNFEWLASESGSQGYPVKIIKGNFELHNGLSQYIPSGALLNSKRWGQYRSTHVSGQGRKPLPTKLNITYFSLVEDKFYQGEFELPYGLILSLFQAQYFSTRERGETRYDMIVAGISPGGGVAVWLNGLDRNTQVFYGQAKEVDFNWSDLKLPEEVDRESYVSDILKEEASEKVLKEIEQHKLPLTRWDNYQKRYHWRLNLLTENRAPKLVSDIFYVNGETEQYFYPPAKEITQATRAIPMQLYYTWVSPQGEALKMQYFFDADELTTIIDQFEADKPSTIEDPILLTIQLFEHKDGRRWGVAVQRDDKEVMLKKVSLKQYLDNDPLDDVWYYQDLVKVND